MVNFVAPLPLARGFVSRLMGVGRNPVAGTQIAFRSRSVHTFGLRRTITVGALDNSGFLIETTELEPNRIYFNRRAHWIAEWVDPKTLPVVGSRWRVK
jgi:hypothetical protein